MANDASFARLHPDDIQAIADTFAERVFSLAEAAAEKRHGANRPARDESDEPADAETENYAGSVADDSNAYAPAMVEGDTGSSSSNWTCDDMPNRQGDERGLDRTKRYESNRVLERYERDLAEKDRRIAQLERYNREVNRRSDLKDLADEGYRFDLDEELAEVLDLPEDRYTRHLEKIRDRYARDISNLPPIPTVAPRDQKPGADANGLTANDARAIVRYARENKIDDHSEAVRRYLSDFKARYQQNGRPA
jgi:hypothetical protein